MGLLKLEIDLPDFKNELNINITVKRDGEVVYSTSSPVTERVVAVESVKKQPPIGGNMMNLEF